MRKNPRTIEIAEIAHQMAFDRSIGYKYLREILNYDISQSIRTAESLAMQVSFLPTNYIELHFLMEWLRALKRQIKSDSLSDNLEFLILLILNLVNIDYEINISSDIQDVQARAFVHDFERSLSNRNAELNENIRCPCKSYIA